MQNKKAAIWIYTYVLFISLKAEFYGGFVWEEMLTHFKTTCKWQ